MDQLQTDFVDWRLGPYHPALPGPLKIQFKLDGEKIVSSQMETGFVHRGLEKAFELHGWRSVMPYCDRLEPEAAIFGELIFCLAVEQIASWAVPPRAQAVRLLISELSRVSAHMVYMARIAKACSAKTIIHYVLRDRERLLDLFELLTGARFSLNYLKLGGLSSDVSEGFLERVLEISELIRIRLKEYNDVFSFNYAFLKRSAGIGVISSETAIRFGITGPNARASGLSFDVRKKQPYCGIENIQFSVPVGTGEHGELGDSHDRFLIRLREITQSLEIVRQLAEKMPKGDYLHKVPEEEFVVPSGEAYVRVESPRGLLGCHVVSDGGNNPCRVQFKVPSAALIESSQHFLKGIRAEDVPVVLASLDFSVAEVDR